MFLNDDGRKRSILAIIVTITSVKKSLRLNKG